MKRAQPAGDALAWVDGAVGPASRARIPLQDGGFLFGHGLFETVRVVEGRAFAWPRHRARLLASAAALGIDAPGGAAALGALRDGLLTAWGASDGVLKIVLTRGSPDAEGALFGLLAGPRPAERGPGRAGLRLGQARPGSTPGGGLAHHKTLAYLPYRLAGAHARQRGYDDALLRDAWGRPTECAAANLLWVATDGALETPSVSLGLLPGVGRAMVLEDAASLSLPIREGIFDRGRLARAREVLVVSALRGVRPVREIEGVGTYPAPGPETQRLRQAFDRRIAACRVPRTGAGPA